MYANEGFPRVWKGITQVILNGNPVEPITVAKYLIKELYLKNVMS